MKYPQRKCLCKCNLSIALCVKCISIQSNDIEKIIVKTDLKVSFFLVIIVVRFFSEISQVTIHKKKIFGVFRM